MNEPANEGQWFQVVIGLIVTGLGLAYGWLQMQLGWMKRDIQSGDEDVLRETSDAIKVLRDELTRRHDDFSAVQQRQHEDNQARIREIKDDIARNAQTATEERRRVIDFLDRINTRVSSMPDRAEMMAVIRVDDRK